MTRRIALGEPATWSTVIADVAAALARNEVVVLPAEGLYGFHALATRPEALAALQRVKPREPGRGWITLVGSLDQARSLASTPPKAEALALAHWPGALTLVLTATTQALEAITGPDGTVAVRSPGSVFLREVLAAAGEPIVSTSANRPGEAPPDRIEGCALDGVALAVDGGPLSGLPSTVVRVRDERVEVLRPGAVQVRADAP